MPVGLINHVNLFIVTFIAAVVLGPILIRLLRKIKFGQTIRDDGPKTHAVKMGTPNMGGLIFLLPLVVVGTIYSIYDIRILSLILITVAFGAVGFVDDLIKVLKKSKDGLSAKQKMLLLTMVSLAFSYFVVKNNLGTEIQIPFLGVDRQLDLAWFFIPFSVIVLLAASNGVNITDGLDGLAGGVTLIVLVFFTVVSLLNPQWEFVTMFSSILAGGCLGFLVYNFHPAKVFMGDTGSLALGGAIGSIAIVMKMPLILLIVGAIYVAETLSVILQVASYKTRKKRIFKMAPLHHHFELSGWQETTIVRVFWIATLLFCFIGLLALRINLF